MHSLMDIALVAWAFGTGVLLGRLLDRTQGAGTRAARGAGPAAQAPRVGVSTGIDAPRADARTGAGAPTGEPAGGTTVETALWEGSTPLADLEQRFSLAVLGANDGLWDWNLETDTIIFSPRARVVLHLATPDLMRPSRDLLGYMHPEDLAGFRAALIAHLKGETDGFEYEYRLEGGDGCVRWVLHRGLAARDATGRVRRMGGSVSDITRRKEAERTLMEARRGAEAAAQAKSDFLAHMSHELRTPLNAIIGFAELMEGAIHGPVEPAPYREYVDGINRSGRHLLALINDILDTAKIEAGRVELAETVVEIPALLTDTCTLLGPRLARRQVAVDLDLPACLPRLWVDERRLRQVLLNLLTNAVKFSPTESRVTLAAEVLGTDGLVLRVIDRGVGMKAEEIPKALESFGQVHGAQTRTLEGTGLGLPLSRALVELHGGRLDIDSHPGTGTTVSVTLPPHRVIVG